MYFEYILSITTVYYGIITGTALYCYSLLTYTPISVYGVTIPSTLDSELDFGVPGVVTKI